MKRKDFFKKLGIGLVAVVATPKILEAMVPVADDTKESSLHMKRLPDYWYLNDPDGDPATIYFSDEDVFRINDVISMGGVEYLCRFRDSDNYFTTYTLTPLNSDHGGDVFAAVSKIPLYD
jgi:hypothetical protein